MVVRGPWETMMPCTIEKMVFGGYGLARTDKGVIFVEQVLPGETVDVEIIGKKGGMPIANPTKILNPSPHRRQPPCEHYGSCGGCDWQHILYPQQLTNKHAVFIDCLTRIGKIEVIPEIEIVSSPEWEYRIRAQLKVNRHEAALGFYKKESNEVVPVKRCPLLDKPVNRLLDDQKEIVPDLPPHLKQIKVITGSDGSVASYPVIRDRSRDTIEIEVGKAKFKVNGKGFFQGNRFLLEKLGTWAKPYVSGKYFVDMYGGCGFFSVLLGENFSEGLLVESSRELTAMAEKNLSLNSINHVTTKTVSGESFFKDSRNNVSSLDCLIVDPPRPGLSREVREGVGKLKPSSIVYISCNPSTQARDVGFLINKCEYTIKKAALFDLYPQTHHIETVLIMSTG